MQRYFSSKRGLSHYLSMASSNYREYLKGNMVKAKKYFYVLRPDSKNPYRQLYTQN